MKDRIFEKVKKYIAVHGMIEPNDFVAAGISGGADSVCMMHLLMRLQKEVPFRLVVVHVNHGLREEAGADAVFVEELCRKWGLPFFLRKVDMPGYARSHKLSEEEAGRFLRYQTFAQVLKEAGEEEKGKIAVAHNADDRAETMLFHMFRGSGLKGLGSIRPVREAVVRPILCLERVHIEAYLREEGLAWKEDATNQEDAYARNRIRHHILPYAKEEICTGAVSHMGELAEILAQTEDYLEQQTEKLYVRYVKEKLTNMVDNDSGEQREEECRITSLQLRLADFRTEDIVMKKRVLLRAMERLTPYRKDITARHIESLLELMEKEGSKELSLPYGIRARKEYEFLFLEKLFLDSERKPETVQEPAVEIVVKESSFLPDVPAEIAVPGTGCFIFVLRNADFLSYRKLRQCKTFQGECEAFSESSLPSDDFLQEGSIFGKRDQNILENRYTKWFDYDKITTSLLLRTRRTGDYLAIDDKFHTQSVKQYMINQKIPKAKRNGMYLLADGSHILWIPGYRVSRQYEVEKSTRRILEVRLKGGE